MTISLSTCAKMFDWGRVSKRGLGMRRKMGALALAVASGLSLAGAASDEDVLERSWLRRTPLIVHLGLVGGLAAIAVFLLVLVLLLHPPPLLEAPGGWATLLQDFGKAMQGAVLPTGLLLRWADRQSHLGDYFWRDLHHHAEELARCSVLSPETLDFWNWRYKVFSRSSMTKPCVRSQPFDLSLIFAYQSLVRMGLGEAVQWRDDKDPDYKTVAIFDKHREDLSLPMDETRPSPNRLLRPIKSLSVAPLEDRASFKVPPKSEPAPLRTVESPALPTAESPTLGRNSDSDHLPSARTDSRFSRSLLSLPPSSCTH